MVTQTNLYAVQLAPVNDFSSSKEELRVYIGLNMLMGIVVEQGLSLYWSGNTYFGIQGVNDVIRRERFKTLNFHLHVNDNTTAVPRGDIGYNHHHKIQSLLTSMRQHNLKHGWFQGQDPHEAVSPGETHQVGFQDMDIG